MANNKVQLSDGTVLIDLTGTTVTADTLANGKTALDKSGTLITGTATGSAITITDTVLDSGGTYRQINAVSLGNDTVDASHLLKNYTAHNAMGEAITGTYTIPLKYGVLRDDVQLVQTYSYDKQLIADAVLASLPSYTTTSTTLVATAELSPTVTLDYANYNYYVLERFLTIPTYSISTKGKGRCEYTILSKAYEIAEMPANNFTALIDGTTKMTSRSVSTVDAGVFQREVYWSDGTKITAYSTAAYSVVQSVVAPTISNGVLTVNSPNFNIRGHTTYFTSTYFNALTDIRYQYKIEVWRAPKNNLNLDGWGIATQAMHIVDCVNSTNHTLI